MYIEINFNFIRLRKLNIFQFIKIFFLIINFDKATVCLKPPYVENADIFSDFGKCQGMKEGGLCYIKCHEGFRSENKNWIKCGKGGTWELGIPKCRKIDCGIVNKKMFENLGLKVIYSNSTFYNSSIKVVCLNPLKTLIGSNQWICSNTGIWKRKSNFKCQELFCEKLIPIQDSIFSPPSCSLSKQRVGTTCSIKCREGFLIRKPSNFTCSLSSKFTLHWTNNSNPYCKDIQPPYIECEEERRIVVMKVPREGLFLNISLSDARFYDNSGYFVSSIEGIPKGNMFKKGITPIVFKAVDGQKNEAYCNQIVLISESFLKEMKCPKDLELLTISHEDQPLLDWPLPQFVSFNNTLFSHTCVPPKGSKVNKGVTNVMCFSNQFPQNICSFKVTVKEPECVFPLSSEAPLHGDLVCRDWVGPAIKECGIICNHGYELLKPELNRFFCFWNGSWSVSTWPDCIKVKKEKEIILDLQFLVETEVSCHSLDLPSTSSIFHLEVSTFLEEMREETPELLINVSQYQSFCREKRDIKISGVEKKEIKNLKRKRRERMKRENKDSGKINEKNKYKEAWTLSTKNYLLISSSVPPFQPSSPSTSFPSLPNSFKSFSTSSYLSSFFLSTTPLPLSSELTTDAGMVSNLSSTFRITFSSFFITSLSSFSSSIFPTSTSSFSTSESPYSSLSSFSIPSYPFSILIINLTLILFHQSFSEPTSLKGKTIMTNLIENIKDNFEEMSLNFTLSSSDPPTESRGVVVGIEERLQEPPCPDNYFRKKNACYLCPRGSFFNSNYSTCSFCPKNFFQDQDGASVCKACPFISITTRLKAQSIDDCKAPCKPGFYSDSGYEPCDKCPHGSFQQNTKGTLCSPCPPHTHTLNQASNSSEACLAVCDPNFFSQSGLVPCSPCPMGKFQVSPNKTFCEECFSFNQEKEELISLFQPLPSYCPKIISFELKRKCFDWLGKKVCICNPGYEGEHCLINIDDCKGDPCGGHGTCVDSLRSFKCLCLPGFKGEKCEEDVDECVFSSSSQFYPCLNNGTCLNNHGGYECLCMEGFQGVNCEINIDDCKGNPCTPGNCSDGINSFSCSCPLGFKGKRCEEEVDPCLTNPCLNKGTCVRNLLSFACNCPYLRTGEFCEKWMSSCSEEKCFNGGRCVDGSHENSHSSCLCPLGFGGPTCQQELSGNFDLVFPYPPSDVFSHPNESLKLFKDMSMVTICLWIRSRDVYNYGTLWSYRSPSSGGSEDGLVSFSLFDYGNLHLIINQERIPLNKTLNDFQWHHVCLSFSFLYGNFSFYGDGLLWGGGYSKTTNTSLVKSGSFVIGRETSQPHQTPNRRKFFVGEMHGFTVFDYILNKEKVIDLHGNQQCLGVSGNVFSWTDVLKRVGDHVVMRNTSLCQSEVGCLTTEECNVGEVCLETSLNNKMIRNCQLCSLEFPVPRECDDVKRRCRRDSCLNGGTCREEGGWYECLCKEGFVGLHCEVDMRENEGEELPCSEDSCINGQCKKEGGRSDSKRCVCHQGWTGKKCQVWTEYLCNAKFCENGGTCLKTQNKTIPFSRKKEEDEEEEDKEKVKETEEVNFVCICPKGFSGKTCGTHVSRNIKIEEWSWKWNSIIYLTGLVLFFVLLLLLILTIFFYRKSKLKNHSSEQRQIIPLRVTNPTYHRGVPHLFSANTVTETIYSEPKEITPYATSEDSERESDTDEGGSRLTLKQLLNWESRQNIPLPEEPSDDLISQSSSQKPTLKITSSPSLHSQTSPPPPYYPTRNLDKNNISLNSQRKSTTIVKVNEQNKYENEAYFESDPIRNSYFVPLSDEEAAKCEYLQPVSQVSNDDYLVEKKHRTSQNTNETKSDASENIQKVYAIRRKD